MPSSPPSAAPTPTGVAVASAVVLAVVAALVVASPSSAAAPRTALRPRVASPNARSAPAGATVAVAVRVANGGRTAVRGARVYGGLTRGESGRPGVRRLGTTRVPATRPAARRTVALRLRVPAASRGRYRLVACAAAPGRRARCAVGAVLTVTAPAGPSAVPSPVPTPPPPSPPDDPAPARPTPPAPLADRLPAAMTIEALTEHTDALDAVGRRWGTRAVGTRGYDDSAAYVLARLARAGYEARVEQFPYRSFNEDAPATATTSVHGALPRDEVRTVDYSGSGDTGPGRPIVPVDLGPTPTPDDAPPNANDSGCEAEDFDGFPTGAIALVKRGTCTYAVKTQHAVDAGAAGVLIFNEGQPGRDGLEPAALDAPLRGAATVPLVATTAAVGEALAAAPSPTGRLTTATTIVTRSSYNVIADTPSGRASETVVVGAHLDSVPSGPGVNDNATGTAFALELAEQFAALDVRPQNRVRFAFWGAEEIGLVGSTAHVAGLSAAELGEVAVDLNFDMLASPNFARLVHDGDFSDTDPPDDAPPTPGSADVERAFVDAFRVEGLRTRPTAFDGRSDYAAFQARGIPAGGLAAGAEELKPAADVPLFGGVAGVPYDEHYHLPGDTREHLNPTAFGELSRAGARVALRYASADVLPAKAPTGSRRRASRTTVPAGDRLGGLVIR